MLLTSFTYADYLVLVSVDADGESVSNSKITWGTLAHYIHDRRIESSVNN